jgi:hypothetical protein
MQKKMSAKNFEKPEKILEKEFTLNYHLHDALFLLQRHMQNIGRNVEEVELSCDHQSVGAEKSCKVSCSLHSITAFCVCLEWKRI